jgi:hypothetical protein
MSSHDNPGEVAAPPRDRSAALRRDQRSWRLRQSLIAIG